MANRVIAGDLVATVARRELLGCLRQPREILPRLNYEYYRPHRFTDHALPFLPRPFIVVPCIDVNMGSDRGSGRSVGALERSCDG